MKRLAAALALLAVAVAPPARAQEADAADDAALKQITFALICGAKFGDISEVGISRQRVDPSGERVAKGTYRQTLSSGLQLGPFNQMAGSYSGAYSAVFDASGQLVKVAWKVGLRQGEVPKKCLD